MGTSCLKGSWADLCQQFVRENLRGMRTLTAGDQGMVWVLVCGIQVEKLGKRRYVEGSRVGGWGSRDWKCPRGGFCVVVTRGNDLERHR